MTIYFGCAIMVYNCWQLYFSQLLIALCHHFRLVKPTQQAAEIHQDMSQVGFELGALAWAIYCTMKQPPRPDKYVKLNNNELQTYHKWKQSLLDKQTIHNTT